jgi:hypothetical protein
MYDFPDPEGRKTLKSWRIRKRQRKRERGDRRQNSEMSFTLNYTMRAARAVCLQPGVKKGLVRPYCARPSLCCLGSESDRWLIGGSTLMTSVPILDTGLRRFWLMMNKVVERRNSTCALKG